MSRYRTQKGMVFLVALLAMVVMLIVGVSFLGSAESQLQAAQLQLSDLHAIALADAGANYMIWNQKYPTQSNSQIADGNILPAGTAISTLTPSTNAAAYRGSLSTDFGSQDGFDTWLAAYTLPT